MSDLGDDQEGHVELFRPSQPYEDRRAFRPRHMPQEEEEEDSGDEFGYVSSDGEEDDSDDGESEDSSSAGSSRHRQRRMKPFYLRWQFWLPFLSLAALVVYMAYSYTDYNRHRYEMHQKYNLSGRIKNIATIGTLEHGHIANDEDGLHANETVRFM